MTNKLFFIFMNISEKNIVLCSQIDGNTSLS